MSLAACRKRRTSPQLIVALMTLVVVAMLGSSCSSTSGQTPVPQSGESNEDVNTTAQALTEWMPEPAEAATSAAERAQLAVTVGSELIRSGELTAFVVHDEPNVCVLVTTQGAADEQNETLEPMTTTCTSAVSFIGEGLWLTQHEAGGPTTAVVVLPVAHRGDADRKITVAHTSDDGSEISDTADPTVQLLSNERAIIATWGVLPSNTTTTLTVVSEHGDRDYLFSP